MDTVHLGDSIRDMMDQRFQLGGTGATGIDNEIGMLGGDTGGTDTAALQTRRFYQACSMIAGRIAKDRTATGLAHGLGTGAPLQ